MPSEALSQHQTPLNEVIDRSKRLCAVAAGALAFAGAAAGNAEAASDVQFTAGAGMTKSFITKIRQSVPRYFLPVVKGQYEATLGNTDELCDDAAKKGRPPVVACIATSTNKIHASEQMLPSEIPRLIAHEMGHKAIDTIWLKEKERHPHQASTFLIDLFMTSGVVKNPGQARNIIRQGPLTQSMSPDMRTIWADEAAAELYANCAWGGFVLTEGATFTTWFSNTANLQVDAAHYNATCHYLYDKLSRYPNIFTPAGQVAPDEPMGVNYYEDRRCSIREDYQKFCKDSD